MNNGDNGFSYSYSAKEQADIKKIRERYESDPSSEEGKLERLHRLDRGVVKKARAAALSVGIVGSLVLGIGMSLVMSDFSSVLGRYEGYNIVIGMAIGIVGVALVSAAYPIYKHVQRREKEKVAPEILRLADELMK